MLDGHLSCTLPDGRQLGYALYGDRDGSPFFFFHGTPGSRFDYSDDDPIAQFPGVCLILPERPGYGLSSPKPDRTLSDWADDVAALADHLGYRRFAVGGISGGGPHALACAHRLGERLTATLVLASPAPASSTRGMAFGNAVGMLLNRFARPLLRFAMEQQRKGFLRNPEDFLSIMDRQLPPSDQEVLHDPAFREALVRSFREAYRQGSEAQFVDGSLGLNSRSWSFDLREISVPVHLWHGEKDRLVSRAMAEKLEREIPRASMCYLPNAGHFLTEDEIVVGEMRSLLTGA